MAFFDLRAAIRSGLSAGQAQAINANEKSELLVSQGLPQYTEATRKGTGWSSMAVLAVAALVVRPSTVAAFEIWNGYGSGGPSLIVDDLFTFNLVATAIQGTFSVWGAVTQPKTAPSAGASVTINGNSGKSYSGSVICGLGTTVAAGLGWRPYGTSPGFSLGTATPGGVIAAPVAGKLIVPPQCSLVIHTVAQTVAWTFQNGASWYEEVISNQ